LARIEGYRLTVPPLRARKEDIYRLFRHFSANAGLAEPSVTFGFMVALCHHAWPYNVRELESAVRRAIALADGAELDDRHLPETVMASMQDYGARSARETSRAVREAPQRPPTADELRSLLVLHKGNVSAVARDLGKDRTQIHRWLRMHALRPEDFRT